MNAKTTGTKSNASSKAAAPTAIAFGDVVPVGETIDRSTTIDIEAGTITTRLTVKANADDSATYVCWTFDVNALEQTELLELAARSLKIDAQRMYRGADDRSIKTWAERTFVLPADMASTRVRTRKAPTAADLKSYLATLTVDERLEFINAAGGANE